VSAIDTDHFRELLVEERRRVVAAIANLHDDHAGTLTDESGEEAAFDNHLADTATETYDRELDYTLEENSEHVLAEVDAALKRIEDGTYGICTNRGEQIPVERLEALPYATLCIDCQRERER
jgi:RNA polymerase-binding transcription factor